MRQLGDALFIQPSKPVLDFVCGKDEMLCTWARDYQITGTGVDVSSVFIASARDGALNLGVQDQTIFIQADASDFVAETPVDIASCFGATWIGNGVSGTVEPLRRNLATGGIMLIGHPYWRTVPSSEEAITACGAKSTSDWLQLWELIEHMQTLDCDVVEMMLADQHSWDRYVAAQWRNLREFSDDNPQDELTPKLREELRSSPMEHTSYQRDCLGWGLFALEPK